MKFLKAVSASSKSRTRLKHYLILSSRFLLFASIIFFLIFYFTLNKFNVSGTSNILLDNSPSSFIDNDSGSPYNLGLSYLKKLNIELTEVDLASDFDLLDVRSSLNKNYDHIISDFQHVKKKDLEKFSNDTTRSKYYIHLGDISTRTNLFVDSLFIQPNSDDFGKKRIVLVPALSGRKKEGTAVFRLLNEGRQLSSVVKDFNDLTYIDFDIPTTAVGEFLIQIEGDNVFFDNEFYFFISKVTKPKILIVNGTENEYLNTVYENNNIFDLKILDSKTIDYNLVEKSDFIILNEVKEIPSGFLSVIKNKTILVFPYPEQQKIEEWSEINNSIRNVNQNPIKLELDYKSPLLKGIFNKINKNSELPYATPFFDLKGDYETIFSLADEQPYLVKLTGKDVYFFNSPLDSNYTNIVSHTLFLPIMYRLVFSSLQYDKSVYFRKGDLINLEIQNSEFPPKIKSNQFEEIPEFYPNNKGLTFVVPNLEPGYYEANHIEDTMFFAVNMPKEESMMNGLSKDELKAIFSENNRINVLTDEKYFSNHDEFNSNLWRYELFIIFSLIVLETLFHRFLK